MLLRASAAGRSPIARENVPMPPTLPARGRSPGARPAVPQTVASRCDRCLGYPSVPAVTLNRPCTRCTGAASPHENSGVVTRQTHDRQSCGRGLIADRVLDQPAASAHQGELIGVGGDGVASDRGQVLERQRTANQQVVGAVGARRDTRQRPPALARPRRRTTAQSRGGTGRTPRRPRRAIHHGGCRLRPEARSET